MKVRIDEELCTGCGLCEETAPEVFELVDDKAVVKGTEIKKSLIEQVKEAADDCPAEAIIIEA
jgi:ferredoxin